MEDNYNNEEVVAGNFRARFCECGRCNGNVHWDVWYNSQTRTGQFTSALTAIVMLIEFVASGKIGNKYKAMNAGQRLLRRLPIVDDYYMSAAEAEAIVLRKCPSNLTDIVEKIFAEFKSEETELANRRFGRSADDEFPGGRPILAAVNE